MNRTLPLLLILAACGSEDRPTVASSAPAALPALTSATQTDLARDLDLAEARGTWFSVTRKWQGQVLRWKVTRHRTLCRTAEACNVAAFPVQRPAKHGWLPELSFAPGQFAALEARCGTAESCDVTIEGTLDKLELSGEMPTNLRLGNVRIVTTTARR
jgi:hypothetical protein